MPYDEKMQSKRSPPIHQSLIPSALSHAWRILRDTQYGAKDHYHELADKDDPDSCKFKENCSECGNNPRPSSCIMYQSRIQISDDGVVCSDCKQDMFEHLNSHHNT